MVTTPEIQAMTSYDKIFDAVFPPPSDVSDPTPTATPVLGSSIHGASFGSPDPSQTASEGPAFDQITWNRCWHAATSFLALPDQPIDVRQDEDSLKKEWAKPYTSDTRKALQYLAPGMLGGRMQQEVLPRDDLLAWYFESAALGHYKKHILPDLIEVCS